MKKFLLCIAITIGFLSCNKKVEPKETVNSKTEKESNNFSKTAVYEGTLPCADCSGIKTVLKIFNDYSVSQNNKFEIISTYEGKQPQKDFIEKGNFNTERGLENDPDGTIYVLNLDQPQEKQIHYGYYSSNPNKIYLLDKDRKIIKSQLNFSLSLKK